MKTNYSYTVFTKLKLLLLYPFFTLGLYFLLLVFIFPFYIYRSVVHLVARCSDLRTSKILTGLSASLLRDYDVHQEKPLSTIVVLLRGRGKMTLTGLRELFRIRVILKRDSIQKEFLQFPELQQYYNVFKGYVFLQWDREFNLDNHVKVYEGRKAPLGRSDIQGIWQELMVKPFEKERSPWELFLIDNGISEDTSEDEEREYFLFFRIHHGIADGFSVQKMLLSLDRNYCVESSSPISRNCSSGPLRKFFLGCSIAIFGPYDLLKKILIDREKYHTLHLPNDKLSKEYYIAESDLINMAEVKIIKKHFGVGVTAVLISVITGTIQKFLKRTGRFPPQLQVLGIPFATREEGSEGRLGNDFLIAPINLPIHISNSYNRIRNIQGQLLDLRRSTLPQMLGFVIDCLSCLPVGMMRSLTKKSLFSTAYSTLPGPMKPIQVPDARLEEVNFTYGTGAASLGLCFSSITYLNFFRIIMFVDRKVIGGRRRTEEMMTCLLEEFEYLKELSLEDAK